MPCSWVQSSPGDSAERAGPLPPALAPTLAGSRAPLPLLQLLSLQGRSFVPFPSCAHRREGGREAAAQGVHSPVRTVLSSHCVPKDMCTLATSQGQLCVSGSHGPCVWGRGQGGTGWAPAWDCWDQQGTASEVTHLGHAGAPGRVCAAHPGVRGIAHATHPSPNFPNPTSPQARLLLVLSEDWACAGQLARDKERQMSGERGVAPWKLPKNGCRAWGWLPGS